MPAGRGEVSLWASKAHDARGIAADGRFRNVVAAGDVADIGERQHLLSKSSHRLNPQRRLPDSQLVAAKRHLISSRRVSSLHGYYLRACWRARRAWQWNTPAAPATPAAPTASASSTHVQRLALERHWRWRRRHW
eukprot:scaffold9076_cov68-Phaeocystis_antarctica.AAC.5